jgi:SAM-dependent methyltransferase
MSGSQPAFEFNDGAAYERYMGRWSRLAGGAFLDWLRPPAGLRWLDVGCGNGAFTEMIAERCAPVSLQGIDPSEAQLAFARTRPALRSADLRKGDAMALPFDGESFDAAVMPLVIFFVPAPAQGVAEMARVVAPGGLVCAYSWDLLGRGFPYALLEQELKALGHEVPTPPHPEAAEIASLRDLWTQAGLEGVETRVLEVQRTFSGFDDYWQTVLGGPGMGRKLAVMGAAALATVQDRVRARLPGGGSGPFTLDGRCHAVKGVRPGRSTR